MVAHQSPPSSSPEYDLTLYESALSDSHENENGDVLLSLGMWLDPLRDPPIIEDRSLHLQRTLSKDREANLSASTLEYPTPSASDETEVMVRDAWKIPSQEIKIGTHSVQPEEAFLGSGEYAQVYLGTCRGKEVAVIMLNVGDGMIQRSASIKALQISGGNSNKPITLSDQGKEILRARFIRECRIAQYVSVCFAWRCLT